MTTDLKGELLGRLQDARAGLLAKTEGLGEYDRRRPLTPTGTNLIGLVKHLSGLEYTYLGASFGRPPATDPPWYADDVASGADMWAKPDESSDAIIAIYRQACAHADATVAALDLDAPGSVAHWPVGGRDTTLGVLLIRMVGETAQHVGHADIVRELIDGQAGNAQDRVEGDVASWRDWTATIQAAADGFRDR